MKCRWGSRWTEQPAAEAGRPASTNRHRDRPLLANHHRMTLNQVVIATQSRAAAASGSSPKVAGNAQVGAVAEPAGEWHERQGGRKEGQQKGRLAGYWASPDGTQGNPACSLQHVASCWFPWLISPLLPVMDQA